MLTTEKEALSGAIRQREAELLAAQSLVREKEEALSQEQQRSSQEKGELRGQLAEKVRTASTVLRPPPCHGLHRATASLSGSSPLQCE